MSNIDVSTFNLPTILALVAVLVIGFVLGRIGRVRRDERFPEDQQRSRRETVTNNTDTLAPFPAAASEDMPPEVIRHLQAGAVINAIKVFRDANPGMSLKTAKDTVQAYARLHGLG